MFEVVLDALAAATGCDRDALGAVVGAVPESGELSPGRLVNRIAAQENAANALQAAQAHDLAAFAAARLAEDRAQGCPVGLAGRTAAVEVGLACRLSTVSGQYRIHDATRAVRDHPQLLALVGTGRVSMGGLRRVLAATDILEPGLRRLVDARLAGDAVRARLSPAKLDKAAQARVLAADPDAAAKRAAAARSTRRSVRLGDPVDGIAGIYATLRAEEALAVFTRLDGTARGMRRDGADRSIDTLMADLFVEWVTGVPMRAPHRDTASADPAASGTAGADAAAGSPVWSSTHGCAPWTWSAPPGWPEPDPEPADPAWDTFSGSDSPRGPAGPVPGDCRPGRPGGWPADDPFDRDLDDDLRDHGDGLAAHPAHAPPAAPSPEPPARRLPASVEVQVVISAATLLGLDDQPGMLRGYGAVPAAVIADLVDTAQHTDGQTTLRGLFCDPVDGRLVAMDSATRYFTGGLRHFGLWRDQDCRLTGGKIVDLDHVRDHQHGGATCAANGQGLGKLAHVLKDHPGMHATVLPRMLLGDGLDHLRHHAPDVKWTTPTGHSYVQPPPPVLGHGTHPDPAETAETDQPSVGEPHLAALLATQR